MDDRFDDTRIEIEKDTDARLDPRLSELKNAVEQYELFSEYYRLRDTAQEINANIQEAWKVLVKNDMDPDLVEAKEKYPTLGDADAYKKHLSEKFDRPTPEHEELTGSFGERLKGIVELKGIHSPSLDLACDKFDEKSRGGRQSSFEGIFSMITRDRSDIKVDDRLCINMSTFIKTLDAESKLELIPRTAEESMHFGHNNDMNWRDYCQRQLTGFVNINMETMDRLSEVLDDRKCLEVMAGNGLLSRCLQDRGIDVLATDKSSPKDNDYSQLRTEQFTDIRQMDAIDAIREYGRDIDVLIMSWPPYDSEIAARCAEELYNVNPEAEILYIGESFGGCTADDEFFELTESVDDDRLEEVNDTYTSYYGIHDYFDFVKYRG